jgi:hypothetical protein
MIALPVTDPVKSEIWDPATTTYDSIWPSGGAVTTTYVLVKPGYTLSDGTKNFFGIVVWNTNTIGHVYSVRVGSAGANFRNVVAGAVASRTSGFANRSGGSTGSGDTGGGIAPRPRPHPVGDHEHSWFSVDELNNAVLNAQAIHNATVNMLNWAPAK